MVLGWFSGCGLRVLGWDFFPGRKIFSKLSGNFPEKIFLSEIFLDPKFFRNESEKFLRPRNIFLKSPEFIRTKLFPENFLCEKNFEKKIWLQRDRILIDRVSA